MGKPHDECMIELLKKDPEFAAEYLKISIKENTKEELATAMHLINKAGYEVSVTSKPTPTPRKRTKAKGARPTPRKRTKAVSAKTTARRSASRSRARRSVAVATA